ncbi:S-adenosyl-L-methionine-dependent methyltransferase [Roridomyces roridus]|uniref:S-adenosyl-L-methionine-dependent methyltransferase n=1 Tax=Roridomyces roridus TaxID=1738132 RepID=A0AAD7BC67_9AGAR|nr:S-adenosyl-L-methionine-dependent methyltransferase [Roridomyces roridus]
MAAIQTLRRLVDIISESLDSIEGVYGRAGTQFPNLNDSKLHDQAAEALQHDPAVASQILNIVAAASQISAAVSNPAMFVLNASHAPTITACLRVACELDVAERLRDAGSEGLHIETIAPGKIDSGLLARVLRLLATHHIFREVSPDVFANNRISAVLDKGKALEESSSTESRLANATGPAAVVEMLSDDNTKVVAFLGDAVQTTQGEVRPGNLPFNHAFKTDEIFYTWVERPENVWRRRRFGFAMDATAAWEPPQAILIGFDWSALQAGSLVVDVGGDLDNAIKGAKLHWQSNFSSHIDSEMVTFQGHNFFTPQPITDASIFLLRSIVHNWPDEKAVQILQRLRAAAQPTTRLLVVDMILAYACAPLVSGETHAVTIEGTTRPSAPAPLLANWGPASSFAYTLDLTVYSFHGGEERTLGAFLNVFARAGWKLVRVYHPPAPQLSHLECIPV